MQQTNDISGNILWYFEKNGEDGGISIIPAVEPTLKLASHSSATAEGVAWYIKEHGTTSGCFSISNNPEFNGYTSWNDFQGGGNVISYWTADDPGSAWTIEPVSITKDELNKTIILRGCFEAFESIQSSVIENLSGLDYLEKDFTTVEKAADARALQQAVDNFSSKYITIKCQSSNNYLKAGDTQASFVGSPANYEHVIKLVSVGDGSFYLQGLASRTYIGDVLTSTQIYTTPTPDIPFYIQKFNNYAVIRPTKYGNGDQHYIHNNGCVGWGRNTERSQFIIEEASVDFEILINSKKEEAKALIESFNPDNANVPGYLDSKAPEALQSAVDAVENYSEEAYAALHTAVAAAKSSIYAPRTDRYYTITNVFGNRGAVVYNSAQDSNADATNNNSNYLWYKTGGADSENLNDLWGFIEIDGKYYLYNVGKQRFAAIGKGGYGNTWIFSKSKPAYITLDAGGNGGINTPDVRIRATDAIDGNTYTMSISTNYTGPVITYDTNSDPGVPMRFAESSAEFDSGLAKTMREMYEGTTPYHTAIQETIEFFKENKPFGAELGKYSNNGDCETIQTAIDQANAADNNMNATKDNLVAANTTLKNAYASLTLNMPQAGQLLRIRSERWSDVTPYLGSQNTTCTHPQNPRAEFVTSKIGNNELATIFYYDENKSLINLATGLRLVDNENGFTAYKDIANGATVGTIVSFQAATNGAVGKYNVLFNDGDRGLYTERYNGLYYTDAANVTDTNVPSGNVGYVFSLENVTSLPVLITSAGWATLYAPVALNVPTNEGITAYTVTIDNDNAKALLTSVETIAAGTGVVLEAEEGGTYNFSLVNPTDISESTQEGELSGAVYTQEYDAYTTYILANGDDGIGFYRLDGGDNVVKGCKAVLPRPANGAPAYIFHFGSVTGIDSAATTADKAAAAYDLAGRRVSKATKGLYIVDGKKVIVK